MKKYTKQNEIEVVEITQEELKKIMSKVTSKIVLEDVDDDKEFALLQTLILARFSAYVLAEVFDKK